MQSKNKQFKNILSQGDFFGTQPKLFIDNKTKFKTTFGAIMSISLFAIVCISCWVYGKDMYYKQNPNSIFTEESNPHPTYFKIDKNTMNFAFGLTHANWTNYYDESIYSVLIEQYTMTTFDNGEMEYKITNLNARRCTKNDFGIAQNYFQSLPWLDKLYCIDNYDLANMEGDFGAQVFSAVQGHVKPCQNKTDEITQKQIGTICKPQEEINSIIKDNYWALYMSDTVINPKNYENPFEPVGRVAYGFSSGQMFKQIDLNFRNVFIEDNTGIIFDHITQKRGIQYMNADKLIKTEPLENGEFLQFLIRFEKVKQTKLYRTYLNIAQVLANVGGILKVCMILFMILSHFVADKYYNINIVNSLFNFDNDFDGNKNNKYNKEKNNQGKLFFNSIFKVFIGQFYNQNARKQKKMLQYSVRKLSYHLDIKRILQKLIEIDKLKMLLLDEQQIKLFEYLPKPTITEQMCIEDKKSEQQINDDQEFQNTKQLQQINLLFEDTRSNKQKAEDAYEAFKSIQMATTKDNIDVKIIEIMDQKLKLEFTAKLNIDKGQKNFELEHYKKDRCSIVKTLQKSQQNSSIRSQSNSLKNYSLNSQIVEQQYMFFPKKQMLLQQDKYQNQTTDQSYINSNDKNVNICNNIDIPSNKKNNNILNKNKQQNQFIEQDFNIVDEYQSSQKQNNDKSLNQMSYNNIQTRNSHTGQSSYFKQSQKYDLVNQTQNTNFTQNDNHTEVIDESQQDIILFQRNSQHKISIPNIKKIKKIKDINLQKK